MTDAFVKSDEGSEWYEEPDIIFVQSDDTHVWMDETHLIGVEPKDEVEIGDIYCYPRGISEDDDPHVVEVVELTEEESDTYAVLDDGEEIHVGFLLGQPMQMAQTPPPIRLQKVD